MSNTLHNAIRDAITQPRKNQFVRVSFVKKDGSIRHITHCASVMSRFVKQDEESKAKAARNAANNPHIVKLFDIHEYNRLPGDQKARAFRSVDLNRVFEVKTEGRVIPFGRVVSHVVPLGA